MKKTILFFFGLLLITTVKAYKTDGQIIYSNDTVDVFFEIPIINFLEEPNYPRIQNDVKYYSTDGKKLRLLPSEAIEIRFYVDEELIRMVSVKRKMTKYAKLMSLNEDIFLKIEIDGYAKLFTSYVEIRSDNAAGVSSTTSMISTSILKIGDGELERITEKGFRKKLETNFKDCYFFMKRIDEGKYKFDDLEEMVKYFNSECI